MTELHNPEKAGIEEPFSLDEPQNTIPISIKNTTPPAMNPAQPTPIMTQPHPAWLAGAIFFLSFIIGREQGIEPRLADQFQRPSSRKKNLHDATRRLSSISSGRHEGNRRAAPRLGQTRGGDPSGTRRFSLLLAFFLILFTAG